MTEPSLGRLLLERERWLDRAVRARLAAQGLPELGRSHSLVFAHLDREGTRISELARRAGVSRQSTHQAVGELVAAGLVELAEDPAHRQARLVRLTDRGRRVDAAAGRAFREAEAELERRIGAARVRDLRAALSADWGPPA